MARRFIVDNDNIEIMDKESEIFKICGKEVKHIQVLRHEIGDEIIVNDCIAKINEIRKDCILLEKLGNAPKIGVPNTHLTLYIAMLKNEKIDYVIQKATELGCSKIVPFFSKNTIVKLDEKSCKKRREKLQIIADEACKQCGRTDRVYVEDILYFNDIMQGIKDTDACIFAYEKSDSSLKSEIEKVKKLKKANEVYDISLIIGPEGGFDEKEANTLCDISNVYCVSLGSRILRADTAAINLISVIMHEFE